MLYITVIFYILVVSANNKDKVILTSQREVTQANNATLLSDCYIILTCQELNKIT